MTASSSLRDLILITHEEYISLKQQAKKPDACEKQKQHILSNMGQDTGCLNRKEKYMEGSEPSQRLSEDALVAQLNLNSRYPTEKEINKSSEKVNEARQKPSDQVLSNLLESGVTGGKVERSRQILKKIEDCERTTIDDTNHTIILDQQDTEISVVEFLSALQVNTKQLPKKFLTLVEVLRLPQFLLANTYARHTSSQNQHQIRLAAGASPYKKQKLDSETAPNQWLTNF